MVRHVGLASKYFENHNGCRVICFVISVVLTEETLIGRIRGRIPVFDVRWKGLLVVVLWLLERALFIVRLKGGLTSHLHTRVRAWG
jgi:hypothetical protein